MSDTNKTFYWVEFFYLGQVYTLDRLGPLPKGLTTEELEPYVVGRWDNSEIGRQEIAVRDSKELETQP